MIQKQLIEELVEQGHLTLTGSSAFGADNPKDLDYFGAYTEDLSHVLTDVGFSDITTDHEEYTIHARRFKSGIYDVFLFGCPGMKALYQRGHDFAKACQLCNLIPDKAARLRVFAAVTHPLYVL